MNNPDYHGAIESGVSMSDVSFQNVFSFQPRLISENLNSNIGMKGLHQLHSIYEVSSIDKGYIIPDLASKQNLHKKVTILLQECLRRQNRTKDKIMEAIEIIHENGLTGFGHLCRSFVYYPYALYLYLQVHQTQQILIDEEDLGAMIARCIEYSPSKETSDKVTSGERNFVSFAQESLQHLFDYKSDREMEIKLLPKRYTINQVLYNFAKENKVKDRYYDASLNQSSLKYEYPDIVAKERSTQYTGYRDAYHLLLYGTSSHLQSLIVRWDLWGDDCTADAARDFFELPEENSIDIIKYRINELSSRR